MFRHYWILAKLVLTIGATIVLLLHLPAVGRMSGVAAETTLSRADLRTERIQLVLHAGGGLLVLLATTTLAVYKPWGRVQYGWRRMSQSIAPPEMADLPSEATGVWPARGSTTRTPWGLYVLLGIICLVVLLVVRHIARGGIPGH